MRIPHGDGVWVLRVCVWVNGKSSVMAMTPGLRGRWEAAEGRWVPAMACSHCISGRGGIARVSAFAIPIV